MRNAYDGELTETQLNVLWSLAIDGASSSQREVSKRKIGKEPWKREVGKKSTVQRALRFLESEGLVKVGEPRGGRRKMSCDLTAAGLFALIASDSEAVWKNLDRIIVNHTSKVPLIFDNWNYFVKDKVADDVKHRIVEYFVFPSHFYLSSYPILRHRRPEKRTEQLLGEDLTRHVLLPYLFPYMYEFYLPGLADYLYFPVSPFPHMEAVEGWMDVMLRYPDLRQYILEELERLEDWCKRMSRTVRRWKCLVQKLEKAQKGEGKEDRPSPIEKLCRRLETTGAIDVYKDDD